MRVHREWTVHRTVERTEAVLRQAVGRRAGRVTTGLRVSP
jgi:hypothetical protein